MLSFDLFHGLFCYYLLFLANALSQIYFNWWLDFFLSPFFKLLRHFVKFMLVNFLHFFLYIRFCYFHSMRIQGTITMPQKTNGFFGNVYKIFDCSKYLGHFLLCCHQGLFHTLTGRRWRELKLNAMASRLLYYDLFFLFVRLLLNLLNFRIY